MPFGGNATPFSQENHPVHGETANSIWNLKDHSATPTEQSIRLTLRTSVRQAEVTKWVRVVKGHDAVY